MKKTILITGATGGLGSALARAYADKYTCLILTGRDTKRLFALASECEVKGAKVMVHADDVTSQSFLTWLKGAVRQSLPDLVIASAGITSTTGIKGEAESLNAIEKVMDVNFKGVVRSITPVIDEMRKRKRGQIAIISSIAAIRALPQSPAHCASKAALKIYGESLRIFLKNDNIKLNIVLPGFVKTNMSDKLKGSKFFMVSAIKAANIIKAGLERDKPVIAFPKILYYLVRFLNCLPEKLTTAILLNMHVSTDQSYLKEE